MAQPAGTLIQNAVTIRITKADAITPLLMREQTYIVCQQVKIGICEDGLKVMGLNEEFLFTGLLYYYLSFVFAMLNPVHRSVPLQRGRRFTLYPMICKGSCCSSSASCMAT